MSLKNVDRDGKPVKSGVRVEFDGLGLPVEPGIIKYDPRLYGWHFVADDGNIHTAVVEWWPGKRIFKYYRVVEDAMLAHPPIGATVQIWYKKSLAHWFPLHGKLGTVEIVARGRGPRNHGIRVDGRLYAIPCGNLRYPK